LAVNTDFIAIARFVYLPHKDHPSRTPHKFSPKKFDIAQIESLVFLMRLDQVSSQECNNPPEDLRNMVEALTPFRQAFKSVTPLTYRRLARLIKRSRSLQQALELRSVPHYSTLAKFDAHSK
jgi:hypothetical protein